MILDSNILIYSIKPEYVSLARYLQANEDVVRVSLFSTLEVLGFNRLLPEDKQLFEEYFQSAEILPITSGIVTQAIRLKQQRKRSPGDAIIAATALIYELPVLTNNTTDFLTIPGLRVIALADILSA